MTSRYARGNIAWGQCSRSGKRVLLKRLVSDGQYPGILVLPRERDPKHPQEIPPDVSDPVALRHPTGDRDRPGAEVSFPTVTQGLEVNDNPKVVIAMGNPTVEVV